MTIAHKTHWNQRYAQEFHGHRSARSWLTEHMDMVHMRAQWVRTQGRMPKGLDLACGPGRNTLFLAEQGWQMTGVDISEEAVGLAQTRAHQCGLDGHLAYVVADLDQWQPQPEAYDLITCFFFLDRALWPAIRSALRPGGLLIMETFNSHRRDSFPSDFLLEPEEFYTAIRSWGWDIVASRSDGPGLPRPTDAIVAVKPAPFIG